MGGVAKPGGRPAFIDLTRSVALVDGALAPTWNWKAAEGMYSGERKTTGFNAQVTCDLDGRAVAIGKEPVPGARHEPTRSAPPVSPIKSPIFITR